MSRLIRTLYYASTHTGRGASQSIEGAIRAAITRIYTDQYRYADIHDLRFGGEVGDLTRALRVQRHDRGLSLVWFTFSKPK